jgi:GNAT superfamily N-acetyltransferase
MTHARRFLIREATPADRDRLTEIFRVVRTMIFPTSPIRAESVDDFLRETTGELVLVASDSDGVIQGWISIWQPESFVHHLYVDPSIQGRGVGRSLLGALPRWVAPPYRLKCLQANAAAMDYYTRCGWIAVGSGASEEGDYALLEWRLNTAPPNPPSRAARV